MTAMVARSGTAVSWRASFSFGIRRGKTLSPSIKSGNMFCTGDVHLAAHQICRRPGMSML